MPGYTVLDRNGSVIDYRSDAIGLLGVRQRQEWLNEQNQRLQGSYADYWNAYSKEINRYWSDYYKNTGYRPRYPYKAGMSNTYSLSSLGSQFGSVGYDIANDEIALSIGRAFVSGMKEFTRYYG